MASTRKPARKAAPLTLPGLEEFVKVPDTGPGMAGIDEAGRGCLAGPVVAAAVVLPEGLEMEGLDDSKVLTESERERLFPMIRAYALAWGIGVVWPRRIDEINILQATFEAMSKAYANLARHAKQGDDGTPLPLPPLALIDGNKTIPRDVFSGILEARCPGATIPRQKSVVDGDARVTAISAASILAKVWRDRFMKAIDRAFPGYGFAIHKGYGTRSHYLALRELGPTPMHRLTFRGVTGTPDDNRPPSWNMPAAEEMDNVEGGD